MAEPSLASKLWRRNIRAILLFLCVLISLGAFWCFDLGLQRGGGVVGLIVGFLGFFGCLYMRRFTRMRFRTADLFVLTALACVGMGAIVQVARVRNTEQLLDQFRKQGGVIRYEVQFETNNLGDGFFVSQSGRVIPNWCATLLGKSYFSPLKSISFNKSVVTVSDSDVELFGQLPRFSNLNLANTSISSVGLRDLLGPNELKVITLRPDQLDETAAKALRTRFPNLQNIRVSRSVVLQDTDTNKLRLFDKVAQVKLDDIGITNASIDALCELPQLRSLTIGEQTQITSAGLRKLKQVS